MARDEAVIESVPDAGQQAGSGARADLFIGIAGVARAEDVHRKAEEVLGRLALAAGPAAPRTVVAYPDGESSAGEQNPHLRFVGYDLPASEGLPTPWASASMAHRALARLAVESEARVAVLLSPDLLGFEAAILEQLTFPVIDKQIDLVTPTYPLTKYDGLLNASILAPLNRALYGKRVRYPLAPDLAISPAMAMRLSHPAASRPAQTGASPTLWPASLASGLEMQVAQVHLGIVHSTRTDGLELSAVIAQLVGSIFSEMEQNAPLWQRVRGSHPTPSWGTPIVPPNDEQAVDTKPMVQSFVLGARSLQEVWGLILPPVTLLELKRLTAVAAENFRMPDELWVRIVYDFALAYRLRTISRTHLLGALTPLYLGWVASYIGEVSGASSLAAEQRQEQLAKAYEDGKPYLVRRWRWPDRFNP